MKNKILSFVGSRLEGRKGNTQRTSNLSPTNHQRYHRTWGAIFTLVMLFTFAIGNMWGETTNLSTSSFYQFYANEDKDASSLISAASLPSYITTTISGNQNGKLTAISNVTTPHDFSALDTNTKFWRLKTGSASITITDVANLKAVHFYGNGSGSTNRRISTSMKKVSDNSALTVANCTIPENSNSTIKEFVVTVSSATGYSASTAYTYVFTFSGDVAIWGIYVEAGSGSGGGDPEPECPETLTISGTKAYTEGQTISLTANLAKGNGTINYQWYKGSVAAGNAISGATSDKYEKSNCTTADAGDYFCVASKTSCSDAVNADAYAVTVHKAPVKGGVSDLATISAEYTFVPTETLTKDYLYYDNKLLSYGGSDLSYSADNKLKFSSSRKMAIKVAAGAHIKVKYNTSSSRYFYIGTTDGGHEIAQTNDGTVEGDYAAGGVVYMSASGDLNMTKLEITYPAPSSNPIITGAVNEDGWGTVSDAITVTANSTIAISDNVLTCDEKTLTATAADATAEYTYAFDSWSGVTNGQSVTANVTATANFTRTPVNYTLAWNSNGGSELSGTYTSGTVAYGAEITKPANPTRPGYTFVGWAESTTGEAVVVPATMPAANKAYYAKWDEITCPTKGTVYSLSGWKNVTNESSWSGKSEINVEIAGLTITGGKAYAVSITDKKTCGTNGSGDNKTYKLGYGDVALRLSLDCPLQEGDIITITSTASDENAYIFTKTNARTPNVESTATSGSTKTYTVVKDDVLDGEQEVYIWRKTNNTVYVKTLTITRPEKFDITYWKNDGTTTKTVVEGTVIAANSFSREGYRFIEWNTQADGEGDKVNVGAEVTADTEVFAIWAQEFSVSYDNTGAASGAAPTNENKYLANETFKVAGVGSMVAADNYVFGGWNDGTAIYQEDDDYTVTGTVSFVPVWNLQYTVTYKANGGTGNDIIVDNPATIADCVFETPENKLFDKWNVSPEGDGFNYAVGADVATTLVLYAIWKDDECTTNRKSIFKAVMTGDATATVTGENGKEYAGEVLLNKLGGSDSNRNTDATIEGVGSGLTTYKMNGTGAYMYGTLKKGAFQEGDKIQFAVSSTPGTLAIYGAKSSDLSQRVHIADMPAPNAAKVFTYTLTAANAAALAGYDAIGIYRADGVTMNPYMYSLEITGCRDWTIQYDVTFDLNGQSGTAPEAQSLAEGAKVTKPADPAVEGYFFRGWYKEDACTNAWDFANDVVGDENLTLYAKWEADPCTDKKSIVRVVMTGVNAASSAGYNNDEYAGEVVLSGVGGTPEAAEVDANHDGNENGYKLSGGGSCLFAQLKKGVFQEGDVVKVTITKINDNYKVNNVAQQILDIYYGSSASDAALLATISNVDAAGTYSYRLTATDVATIGDKKCIGIYRPNSGRTQNQYVYSVEVSGCREWMAYHTLTFAKEDETVVAAPALAEGVYASTVAPKAPRVSSHHFLGWSTTKNDADAIVNLAEYTITEDKTLYAVYAENDCSGNGLMFSQVAKANTLSEDYSLSGTTEESIGEYATVTGGEVYLNNNSSNTRVKITKTTSAIQLTGGDEGYIHVLLDCPLKEKDTIKVDNTNKWVIAHNASKTDKVSLVSSVHFFIVPAEWEGKDEFYIWRDGSSCNISTIQVIRPVLYTVSFDMMEHGSAIAALTGVPENGKITAPTAPAADNYSFGGWYKEEACTNAWDFANDVVTANTTLYAKWLNLYTVSFDMMEHGSAIAVLMDVPENSKITAPNVPTDENYYFEGWYKENTLENEWNFTSDVVTDNTILYAKWNDKSDATLKSLQYGNTEIALEAGVYEYNINLSPLAESVPALMAVTTNPNATKQITNGTLDSEGHATSTVEVTPEKEGAATQTYTVNFTKIHLYTELVDVTGYTEWNWTGAASGETKINDVENRGKILANYIIGDNFEKLEGQEDARAYRSSTYPAYQGTYLKLHTTVPGKLTMNVRTSSNTPKLRVNGVDIATLSSTVTPYNVVVPAGDVEITSSADEIRIYSMIFDPALDPEKAEESTLKGYERDVRPGYYGTICLPKAGVMTGATLYEIAYRDLNDPYKKIFFDEVLNGTMQAGVPYIFLPNEDVTRLGVYYTNTEVENEAKSANGLKGYYNLNNDDPQAAFEIAADQGNYIIKDNQYREVTVASAYIVQNRAYIKTAEINPTYVAPQPNRRRVAINGAPSVATDIDNIYGNDTKAQKVLINGQLFIIRGEKMYDAAGQLVK